jgi:hypothetical protein
MAPRWCIPPYFFVFLHEQNIDLTINMREICGPAPCPTGKLDEHRSQLRILVQMHEGSSNIRSNDRHGYMFDLGKVTIICIASRNLVPFVCLDQYLYTVSIQDNRFCTNSHILSPNATPYVHGQGPVEINGSSRWLSMDPTAKSRLSISNYRAGKEHMTSCSHDIRPL